jgi:DNA processing protein
VQDTDPIPAASRLQTIADWLRLEQAAGVGLKTASQLLAAFGSPRKIFAAGQARLSQFVPPAQAQVLCEPPTPDTAALIERTRVWLSEPGHQVLTRSDPDYPELLANIPDPPLLLYINGRAELLARPSIAIVGSRNASTQGRANASAFAHALSDAGLTVVSGLALGIDAAAHEGALRGEGSTIAVVGTGLDRIYPASNEALTRRIALEGCIVSEYPLGMPPLSGNFPRRNRIISGLAAGVLVVEAAAGSGSLITAELAAEQGREVFALPGSIHSPLAKGCHKLIRKGACLVETVDEVLEAMHMSPLAGRRALTLGDGPAGDPAVGDALLRVLGHDVVEFDTLLAHLETDAASLNSQLLLLELNGQLERLPGGRFQRVVR